MTSNRCHFGNISRKENMGIKDARYWTLRISYSEKNGNYHIDSRKKNMKSANSAKKPLPRTFKASIEKFGVFRKYKGFHAMKKFAIFRRIENRQFSYARDGHHFEHSSETVLRNTCAKWILENKLTKHNWILEGFTLLWTLLIREGTKLHSYTSKQTLQEYFRLIF